MGHFQGHLISLGCTVYCIRVLRSTLQCLSLRACHVKMLLVSLPSLLWPSFQERQVTALKSVKTSTLYNMPARTGNGALHQLEVVQQCALKSAGHQVHHGAASTRGHVLCSRWRFCQGSHCCIPPFPTSLFLTACYCFNAYRDQVIYCQHEYIHILLAVQQLLQHGIFAASYTHRTCRPVERQGH